MQTLIQLAKSGAEANMLGFSYAKKHGLQVKSKNASHKKGGRSNRIDFEFSHEEVADIVIRRSAGESKYSIAKFYHKKYEHREEITHSLIEYRMREVV